MYSDRLKCNIQQDRNIDMDTQELDVIKLKYVLYARKSTTDESRQVHSIPHQIAECKQLASRLGLHIVRTLQETKSAKKPHQRPIFTQMLHDIRKGLYDSVLAWNPDRLARNMLEAGMLIDMADTGIIKDFKFQTHIYSPDANGKMLLGMSFVLSKQYSDDLSQKVTRGVRRSFAEGKSSAPKHGYIQDKERLYRPDGKNFDLICDAWEMRRQGDSLEVISDYMNKNGYGRKVKKTGKFIRMNPKILTDIFKEPLYYGVMIQANQKVDLRLIYDFQPVTTEEIYNEVQQLSYRRLKPFNTRRRMSFYPFKIMIKCSLCGHNMYVGPSTGGSGKKYLNYRCDNSNCTRKKKSIRAKVILDFIYKFLETKFKLTEADYKKYYDTFTQMADEKRENLQIEIHSREGSLKSMDKEIKERSLKVVDFDKSSPVRQHNEARITELTVQRDGLEKEIATLRSQLTEPEKDRLSLKQFLNLSKKAAAIVKAGEPAVKDKICRIIFLNFSVDEEKVASYQLKPPFDTMLNIPHPPSSRGDTI